GHDEVERMNGLLHAADGGDRHHPLGAERLETPDVRAEVQLARRQAVAAAVARQEDDGTSLESAGAVLGGRVAEGGGHAARAPLREPFQLVQAAAADDPDRGLAHSASSSPRLTAASTAVTRTLATFRRRRSGPGNATSI